MDKCVHCGLCLNACPTYRQLGVEMDSPRGRIYQMVQIASGSPVSGAYTEHIGLCLACRACETACPSGVQYGRLIEDARAEIEARTERPLLVRIFRDFVFQHLLESRTMLTVAGSMLYLYQASGLQRLVRASRILELFGPLAKIESLAPQAQIPFFFRQIGKTFPALGETKYRVAFLAGCIANVSFARLNDATVRVLQKNGCEVVIPKSQTCCGALHAHSGRTADAQRLARRNIDALVEGGFDAVITNAAGCGSTLKEYAHLLHDDPAYAERAAEFSSRMKDVTEFLASIRLNRNMKPLVVSVTYQDSCHLLHGQKIKAAPRQLLETIPGLVFREMPMSDHCCGSAGIYNVLQPDMALTLLKEKMECVKSVHPAVIATANPGCLLQLEAGVQKWGNGQRVMHVVELLDEAYGA